MPLTVTSQYQSYVNSGKAIEWAMEETRKGLPSRAGVKFSRHKYQVTMEVDLHRSGLNADGAARLLSGAERKLKEHLEWAERMISFLAQVYGLECLPE